MPNEDGTIAHAQLTLAYGMVMLGSASETELGRLLKHPDEIGTADTQSTYLVVADADAVYAKAKFAGTDIVMEITNKDHGGRGFNCRDPEGHLWSIGTYDPW